MAAPAPVALNVAAPASAPPASAASYRNLAIVMGIASALLFACCIVAVATAIPLALTPYAPGIGIHIAIAVTTLFLAGIALGLAQSNWEKYKSLKEKEAP